LDEPENTYFDKAFAWILDNQESNDFGPMFDGLEELKNERSFDEESFSDDSDSSEGSSSEFSSEDNSNSSDSESSDSDSDSDESSEFESFRNQNRSDRRQNRRNRRQNRRNRRHSKNGRKHMRAENFDETDEEFLPAMLEDVQPLDLAYIPQASIDKRHGGRHLHRNDDYDEESEFEGGHKGGKGKHGKGKHGKGMNGKHGKNGKGRHGGKGGKGRHGGKDHHGGHGHHMKWCLAIGAVLYTALISTFIGVFKKYTMVWRSYHNTIALQEKTVNLTVE